MSIYSTLWELRFPKDGISFDSDEDLGIVVFAQMVSNFIQDEYPFLPPPVSEDSPYCRAVVITTAGDEKGTERSGEEYRNPLLVLSGEEYSELSFERLHERVCNALYERAGGQ